MKITDVKVHNLMAESKIPIYTPKYPISRFSACYVRVETDEGIVGFGECRSRYDADVRGLIVEKLLRPLLINKDPFSIELLWEDLYNAMRRWGHTGGYFMEAVSGVECALWDIIGKSLNRPVYQLIGGCYRSKIPVYASTVHHDWFKDSAGLADHARQLQEKGINAVKLSIGWGIDLDIENVKTLREAMGKDAIIMVDAVSGYDLNTALKLGRKLERYEVFFFEEPIPPEDIEGYRRLTKDLDLLIAAGECVYTRYGFKELISREAVDIVQPDVGKAGGILECKKIAALASAFHMPVAFHTGTAGVGTMAATIHLAASTPNFLRFEYMYMRYNPLHVELPKSPVDVLTDGHLIPPQALGLGFEVREDVLQKYELEGCREGS